jgi:two-component system, OmpR family, sensor histidine kinase KdpD
VPPIVAKLKTTHSPPGSGVHLLRFAAVAVLVSATTILFYRLVPVNITTAGFAFLIVVLVIAARWGFPEALLASILSVLCFNFFFIQPVGTFNVEDPQNWVALLAFLATAIVASELSTLARQRARQAEDRRQEMERLYALSRAILLTDPAQPAAQQIAERITGIFPLDGVALYDLRSGKVFRAGPQGLGEIEGCLKRVAEKENVVTRERGALVVPIRLGAPAMGALAVEGEAISEAALQALSNLVAIGLEHVRGQEAAGRAEAARQSEELKSTLLDAIAHEFKTPLTSIKASATAMLSTPAGLSSEMQELASIVDEEADRLSRLVTEAMQMASIEAGKIQLSKTLCSVEAPLRDVLAELGSKLEGRAVELSLAENLPAVFADPELIRLALRQVVDNALRYSPPGSALSVRAESRGGQIRIGVADCGPGIPEREQAMIFEKFYRVSHRPQHVTGSGMGLAICREILQAHGGEISVESTPGLGSVFTMSLPVAEVEKEK